MDQKDLLQTYRSYYHPISRAKGESLATEALNQVRKWGLSPSAVPHSIKIVDFASGTGGFVEGFLQGLSGYFPESPREVFLYDQSHHALTSASESVRKILPETNSVHSRVTRFPGRLSLPDSIDWLLQANLLAENLEKSSEMLLLLEEAFLRLNPGGVMILTEPADRVSSRNLLNIRDLLLDHLQDLHILAPCPNFRDAACPALLNEKDWCHEDRPFHFSPEVHSMASSVGHIKDALKMSYLIGVRFPNRPLSQASQGHSTLRLVSELKNERGLGWGIFCNGEERKKIRILTRHRNERNKSFWSLHRGEEILQPLEGQSIVRTNFLDLLPDAPVIRLGDS
ncbi:MAG: small ribosomal subunit Rsm22 family protein [Leptospirales bacterium]